MGLRRGVGELLPNAYNPEEITQVGELDELKPTNGDLSSA